MFTNKYDINILQLQQEKKKQYYISKYEIQMHHQFSIVKLKKKTKKKTRTQTSKKTKKKLKKKKIYNIIHLYVE
jgi:hypothetical protein